MTYQLDGVKTTTRADIMVEAAELRWEVFNLFNTLNFGQPENNFDSLDFGTITATVGGPRVSQFGLRFNF